MKTEKIYRRFTLVAFPKYTNLLRCKKTDLPLVYTRLVYMREQFDWKMKALLSWETGSKGRQRSRSRRLLFQTSQSAYATRPLRGKSSVSGNMHAVSSTLDCSCPFKFDGSTRMPVLDCNQWSDRPVFVASVLTVSVSRPPNKQTDARTPGVDVMHFGSVNFRKADKAEKSQDQCSQWMS